MAGTIYSATLDGVHKFTLNGTQFTWGSNGYLSNIDLWGGDGPDQNTFKLALKGSFDIGNLHLGGSAFTNITDANDGIHRNIETLRLSGLGGTVNLTTTAVESLKMFDLPGAFAARITLGSERAQTVALQDGNDTITAGSGDIDSINMRGGNNTLVGGTGWIAFMEAYDGNDTVTLSGGAGAFRLNDGNNTITLAAGASLDSLVSWGNTTATLAAGTRINSFSGGDGDDNFMLNGDSRIYLLKLDGGNNTVTSHDGNIESLYSYGGNNTLHIGAGGVQQIVLSGDGIQKVTADGFIGSLQCYDNSSTTAVLNGSAINVFTGKGVDSVTVGADQWVGRMGTWLGNDTVTMGVNSVIESLNLDQGDDTFRVNLIGHADDLPQALISARGGLGLDTLNFSQIATQVVISLNLNGAYQTLGAGQISVIEFENMVGSKAGDRLEGDAAANLIDGNTGADRLSGQGGNDTLVGSAGNDTVTGGTGADQFDFLPRQGRDEITDFAVGEDLIRFAAAHKLADITFATQGSDVLLTVGTVSVLVDDVTMAQIHQAGNFMF